MEHQPGPTLIILFVFGKILHLKNNCKQLVGFMMVNAHWCLSPVISCIRGLGPGMLLLDFGGFLAREEARKRGCKTRELWMDPVPSTTMREICTSVIAILWSGEAPLFWGRLSERTLEKRFGRCRSRFPSAQMSVGDYWRASFSLMKKEVAGFQQAKPEQGKGDAELSRDSFQAAASRAWQGVLKLMSMVSDQPKKELQAAFSMAFSEHGIDTLDGEQESNENEGTS